MAFTPNDNFWNAALDGVGTVGGYVSAHSASPGSTGTSELTGGAYARQAVAWSAASAGSKSKTASDPVIPIPAGSTVAYIGLWSALTTGTFYGYWTVTSETYVGAGTYTVDTATLAK
jgi:hypothetical protein